MNIQLFKKIMLTNYTIIMSALCVLNLNAQQISFGPTQFVPVKKGGEVILQDTPVVWFYLLKWNIDSSSTFVISESEDYSIINNLTKIKGSSMKMLDAKFEEVYGVDLPPGIFSYTTSLPLPAVINPGDEFYIELKCNPPDLIQVPSTVGFKMFFTVDTTIVCAEYLLWIDVGISEENVYNISIAPNPAIDFFTINFNLEKCSELEVNLYDVKGIKIKEIYNGFVEEGLFTKTIEVKNLSKGIYFLKINNIIKKIIIL